jgi:hypothetical protein
VNWYFNNIITRSGLEADKSDQYSTEKLHDLGLEEQDLVFDLLELMRSHESRVPVEAMKPDQIPLCQLHQHTIQGESECPSSKSNVSEAASRLLAALQEAKPTLYGTCLSSLMEAVRAASPQMFLNAVGELDQLNRIERTKESDLQLVPERMFLFP